MGKKERRSWVGKSSEDLCDQPRAIEKGELRPGGNRIFSESEREEKR